MIFFSEKGTYHMNEAEVINQALTFYHQGNYKAALKEAEKVLKKNKKNTSALVIKGNVFYQNKNTEQALQYYMQAITIDSSDKSALLNAANIYYELKKYEKAIEFAQQVLKIDSMEKTALSIYGNSNIELENFEEAKKSFLQVLQLDSNDVWSYDSLSKIYQKTEDDKRAVECGWKAVELSEGSFEQQLNFGYLLYEIDNEYAREYAEKWLEKYGKDKLVHHMGNAILNKQKIARSDSEYVSRIFDVFADDFDDILNTLNYCAPQLIEQELHRILFSKKITKLSILDAGCGTGLCGGFLKKYARFHGLYGVDISEKMLQKAAQKKCYDKLIKQDLEAYFAHNKKQFDLIVSSDVLTYFGDLKNIINGFHNSLKKNGRIILTVSKNNVNENDYFLHPSGRFLHHRKYIENLLKNSGFQIENFSENILRNEGDKPVFGYVVSALKKA